MRVYFFSLFLFLFFNNSYSQFGSKFEEIEITFKNDSILKGIARMNNYDLDFKDLNKKNKKTIKFSEIKTVKFTVITDKKKGSKQEIFLESIEVPSIIKSKNEDLLVELLYNKEKIKIYGKYMRSGGGVSMGPGLGGQISVSNMNLGFNSNNYSEYFCQIKDEKSRRVLYRYGSLKTFRIMAADCFLDCEELSKKIRTKKFTIDQITQIGDFYNQNCN